MENIFTAAPEILGPQAEAITTWWMEQNGLGADNRDGAIGTLVSFAEGNGEPPRALFVKFPHFAEIYFTAVAANEAK